MGQDLKIIGKDLEIMGKNLIIVGKDLIFVGGDLNEGLIVRDLIINFAKKEILC